MAKNRKGLRRRLLAFFLCLVLFAAQFPILSYAEDPPVGYVNGTSVNVREGPGTKYPSIGIQLNPGDAVHVWQTCPDANGGGIPWYHISFTYGGVLRIGYIRSDFVTIPASPQIPVVENPDFETQIAAFPADYQEMLRAVHQQHPSWNFEAVNTGLDWNAVQNLENRLGWSFINDGVLSHYSTAPGSYDWETDTYFVKEGSNWYQAAPEMVAYYMDPRNFLNENDLFQFEKQAFSPATQTEENINAMLQGTFMEGKTTYNNEGVVVGYARAFLDAAYTANVSAFHLVTRCIQEVGWGGSACSLGTYPGYEGYYNFFNIGAYSGAGDGMIYAKNKGWDTPYKAIMAGASFLVSGYIARGQDTPYFQKYDVESPENAVSHQYMTNVAAALSEGRIQRAKYMELGMLEASLTFRIPVFSNMPQSVCAMLPAAGSPNNFLKTLSVEGYSLTPSFDFYENLYGGVTNYTVFLDGNVSSLNVSATPVSNFATLQGDLGNVSLSPGKTELRLICTGATGLVREYTINVILNTLENIDGVWYHTVGGQVDLSTTLVYYEGSWYYVKNGQVDWDSETLVNYNGVWYYVRDGKVDWESDTLVNYGGVWFHVKGGTVDWNDTTLVQYNNTWYYVAGGMVNWDSDTLVYFDTSWFHVKGGVLDFSQTLVHYNDSWYYVRDGVVDWDSETLVYYNNVWYYVKDGQVDWHCRTLVFYYGEWYYVAGGMIDWDRTTLVSYCGTLYYVTKGKVDWESETLIYYFDIWYYVKDGTVNWNSDTLVLFYGVWYYVQDGEVNWNYYGRVNYFGIDYTVAGGMLVWNDQ